MFHQWCGLSAIAGAVRRNVFIDFDHYVYFPNMYVVLVGPPASRKTTAMNFAKHTLKQVGDNIIFATDSTTREALIDSLAKAYIGDIGYSAISAFSPEFGNMLQSSQGAMIDFLTGIYDYDKTDFVHDTVGRGPRIIKNPFLNLLACTTTEFINRHLPAYAVGTGFTSRVLFVFCDRIGKLVPRPSMSNEDKDALLDLQHDLRIISEITGTMDFSETGGKWFDEWYMGRRDEIEKADARLAGFQGRKPAHVLKVAMLLSISRGDSLVMEAEDLKRALTMVEALEPGMLRLFCAVGRNVFAPIAHRIVEQLIHAGEDGLTIRELLKRNLGDVDIKELTGTLETITTSGWAKRSVAGNIAKQVMTVTPEGIKYIRGEMQEAIQNDNHMH